MMPAPLKLLKKRVIFYDLSLQKIISLEFSEEHQFTTREAQVQTPIRVNIHNGNRASISFAKADASSLHKTRVQL